MNVVVLRGVLSSAPSLRQLPSGSTLYQLEITTRDGAGNASSVPVAWFDPPGSAAFAEGDEVVVSGAVRRRWFRGSGGLQSRTEVVAAEVVSARRSREVSRLVRRASGLLEV